MVHECFYMPVCEKGWETLLYCVPQSHRWFNSFLHHSRCLLSAGWNRATSSAPKAGNLVPHLLLREPSHKNEGGRARVCLDLCKPSPPRKGGVPSRVQISFLICTYEGQELPIHGRQSIKSGSQSAFYFSLCWVLFPLKKKFSTCHAGSPAFCTGVVMIYSLKENYLFWRCQGYRSQQLWAYEIMTCVFSVMVNYTVGKNFKIWSKLFSHINLLPQENCG